MLIHFIGTIYFVYVLHSIIIESPAIDYDDLRILLAINIYAIAVNPADGDGLVSSSKDKIHCALILLY